MCISSFTSVIESSEIDIAGVVPPEDTIGAVPVTEVTVPVLVVNPAPLVSWLLLVGIVGLFKTCASPLEAFQSLCTFTSAPVAIPLSLVFSADVNSLSAEDFCSLVSSTPRLSTSCALFKSAALIDDPAWNSISSAVRLVSL